MMDAAEHNCVTSFESYSFDYDWKITKFKGRLSSPEPLVCPEDIRSPLGKYPATTWRLEVWKSTDKDRECEVSLTLTSNATVWAHVSFAAKRWGYVSSNSMQCGFTTKQLHNVRYCAPAPATVKTAQHGKFTGYVPMSGFGFYTGNDGNTLIINCHVFVNKLDTPVHVMSSSPPSEIHPYTPEHDLHRILDNARHKDRYTDVTIVTDGNEFKAHKVVLATQSPFFETRLEKRWTEEGGSQIDMQDVPANTILTYMYIGKVDNIDKAACELLPKAEEYQLEELKAKCEEALSRTLTIETVIDILLLADTHNAKNLKESCLTFIAKNIIDVKTTQPWRENKLKMGNNRNLHTEVLDYIVKCL